MPNLTILNFEIIENKNVFFLPRKIGLKFPNLEEFTAKKCSLSIIRSFYFDFMRRVQFIDLSFNEISIIEKRSFRDLFRLKYLFLGNNRIEDLDKEMFQALVNLKYLDVSYNKIKSLETTVFSIAGGSLFEVNLLSNTCINGTYEGNEIISMKAHFETRCPF